MSLFRGREFERASELFLEIYSENPDDYPACFYLQRCDMMARFEPSENWDGAISVEIK